MKIIYSGYIFNFIDFFLKKNEIFFVVTDTTMNDDGNIYHIPITMNEIFFIQPPVKPPTVEPISLDLLDLIFQKITNKKQKQLCSINSYLFNNLKTKIFPTRGQFYIDLRFTQETLSQKYLNGKYCWIDLISLTINSDNKDVKDLNFLKHNLKILSITGPNCAVNQKGIQELQLITLNVHDNRNITNLNHMAKSLKILYADGAHCAVTQDGIKDLHLIELDVSNNRKIYNLNFMKDTLKILRAQSFQEKILYSGITKDGINELNLKILKTNGNTKV
jgi:hypothetical protein